MRSLQPVMRWISAASLVVASATAAAAQTDVRVIPVPGQPSVVRVWTEGAVPHYSISLDGRTFLPAEPTDYDLRLRFRRFDPLRERPAVPAGLEAPVDGRLHVVQYWTQGIEDYHEVLQQLGVEIHLFLANHANVVSMDPGTAAAVAGLPFVRAVSPFHPAYKLEEELLAALAEGRTGPIRVNLLTTRRGDHAPAIAWIVANGGIVEEVSAETHLMSATVDLQDLPRLAALEAVQWIDRWGAPESDMNIARTMHGANFVESVAGFTGQGVRFEVLDSGTQANHPDLLPNLVHGGNSTSGHGTSTCGIVGGSGGGNANARGMMPDCFRVISSYNFPYAGGSRYAHSGELANPALQYRCVLQTNSWGSSLTTQYNSVSQDMDLILFDFARLSILNSQSNAGSKQSRPQAWAKNIISVGGIDHFNTLSKNDDRWNSASIGPAADGRIKPDLASYYDNILTTTSGSGYTSSFGGTSGATPIVAGALGLFYEMWHNGLFNNPTGATPFDSAPNNTTAKAVLINTASQWTFSGTSHNLTRVHQGWGHPDLQYMHEQAPTMLVVDEADVLLPFESSVHFVNVPGGDDFRATMVYRDPPGTTSSTLHRINDLDLSVIAPNGVVYKGNNGLDAGMYSTPGGAANRVDTVENVFVQSPQAGEWRIIVRATALNQDSHVETPGLDADYALAVSGISSVNASCATARVITRTGLGNFNTFTATAPVIGQPVDFTVDTQGFQFATIFGFAQPEFRALDSGFVALVNPDAVPVFLLGPLPGPIANASTVVATSPAMCGQVIYAQVKLDNGPGPFAVTNSQDLVIGN